MPLIRPISDLRNRANEISEICHNEDEPVFITKKGKGDLVVMSQAHYERLSSLMELYKKLGEAEVLDAQGSNVEEISLELKKPGGEVRSLIVSAILKYKTETLGEAREKRARGKPSSSSEEVIIENR